MTSTSHTPGPWKAGSGEISRKRVYGMGWSRLIADCDTREMFPSGDACANARLIAAAPELLQALKLLLEHASDLSQRAGFRADGIVFQQARTALIKATEKE
jgi:hypothetical protein